MARPVRRRLSIPRRRRARFRLRHCSCRAASLAVLPGIVDSCGAAGTMPKTRRQTAVNSARRKSDRILRVIGVPWRSQGANTPPVYGSHLHRWWRRVVMKRFSAEGKWVARSGAILIQMDHQMCQNVQIRCHFSRYYIQLINGRDIKFDLTVHNIFAISNRCRRRNCDSESTFSRRSIYLGVEPLS